MRIQAIATLTTAAAVSFFGFQDPETTPDSTPEKTHASSQSADFAWENGSVETGAVERYQSDGSSPSEPDPFEVVPSGGFPVAPSSAPADPEPVNLAELTDDEIIDFSNQPDLVDITDPSPSSSIDSVSTVSDPGEADTGMTLIAEVGDDEAAAPRDDVAATVEDAIAALETIESKSPESNDAGGDADALTHVDETGGVASLDATADEGPAPLPGVIEPVESVLPKPEVTLPEVTLPEVTLPEVSTVAASEKPNRSSLELDLDGDDATISGVVNPGAIATEGAEEDLPSVATSVASQLVDSVTEAVGAGNPDGAGGDEADQAPTMGQEQDGGGFWLKGARLNEVYQYLARLGGMQYFHNTDLDAANFVVTGHLGDGDPIAQMEELGLMYGITVHTKGSTVYALTNAQLAQLPTMPFQYHLNYLRPTDIEQIKTILQPVLTPGSGTVDYEQKTNTLIVIDNEQKIQNVKDILAELDQPKDQIAIETRILRITSGSRNRIGVDWESVLGEGLTFSGVESLNTLFNLPDRDVVTEVVTRLTDQQGRKGFTIASAGILGGAAADSVNSVNVNSTIPESSTNVNVTGDVPGNGSLTGFAAEVGGTEGFNNSNDTTRNISSTGSHLVLSPLALNATLRALNQGGLAQQESSPTMVTEDNEPGVISIIDRVPIIITTISETTAGQNISEEVRYRVDLDDPVNDPLTTREIGVTVSITPTLLPDNTVRMALRPRSAQIVEFVEGQSGNFYPRVNESTVDTIARVPNGHSLLIGGFYEQTEKDATNKVPVLGDIPGLNFLFKSTDKEKENTSLVFVVTPKKYSPVIIEQSDNVTRALHERHVLPRDHAWPDRENPGFNYEPNLGWTVGNIANQYPETPPTNPLHPDHPVNEELWLDGQNGPAGDPGVAQAVQPVAATAERQGFFKKLFRKRQR